MLKTLNIKRPIILIITIVIVLSFLGLGQKGENTSIDKYQDIDNKTHSQKVSGKINKTKIIEEKNQINENPYPIFTTPPIDIEYISSIIPLGALSPPSHVFPTDHIYFMITRLEGSDRPIEVPVYSPGDLIITSIRATEHVKAGITDYVIFLEPPEFPEISIMFIHISSLNEVLFIELSGFQEWSFDSEYTTGDEIYRTRSINCNIRVKAGVQLGTAGGNPGQWALDLGVYDTRYLPEQIANIERWKKSRYLHTVCPLSYYEGKMREALTNLVQCKNSTCGQVMQDVPGTAQGCWFLDGVTETYPEDPHLALVSSNTDPAIRVLSVGNSIKDLSSRRYEFVPTSCGQINREFKEITPDGKIYGYDIDGFNGVIIILMYDSSTLWVEAINGSLEPENWDFTENRTIFVR